MAYLKKNIVDGLRNINTFDGYIVHITRLQEDAITYLIIYIKFKNNKLITFIFHFLVTQPILYTFLSTKSTNIFKRYEKVRKNRYGAGYDAYYKSPDGIWTAVSLCIYLRIAVNILTQNFV